MGIGTHWRLTTSDFDQWVVDGLNQIQIALDQFQSAHKAWPNYRFSFDEAEEFIDELRSHFADREDTNE